MTSQMSSFQSSNVREVVFWDTNTLHYVDVYLQHAKENGLYPYGDPIDQSETVVKSTTDRNLKTAYENGLAVLAFCRQERLAVSYSPVSELELIVGRAKGKALISAAEENIPERMWSRFQYDEKYINRRLTPAILTMTVSHINDFASQLSSLDISVIEGAESGVTETWILARKLLSVMYMSVNDALIYASALLERARYIVTFDYYFRKTINRCHSGKYETARNSIAAVLGTMKSLPRAPKREYLRKCRNSYS